MIRDQTVGRIEQTGLSAGDPQGIILRRIDPVCVPHLRLLNQIDRDIGQCVIELEAGNFNGRFQFRRDILVEPVQP